LISARLSRSAQRFERLLGLASDRRAGCLEGHLRNGRRYGQTFWPLLWTELLLTTPAVRSRNQYSDCNSCTECCMRRYAMHARVVLMRFLTVARMILYFSQISLEITLTCGDTNLPCRYQHRRSLCAPQPSATLHHSGDGRHSTLRACWRLHIRSPFWSVFQILRYLSATRMPFQTTA